MTLGVFPGVILILLRPRDKVGLKVSPYSHFSPCTGDIFLKASEEYDIITNEGK